MSNKAIGNAHEAWTDSHHEVAKRTGILARIDKIDPPAERRKGIVDFGERTGADYIGLLNRGVDHAHRYLAVEDKSSVEDRLYKKVIKANQQQHLNETVAGGGLALLVVEFRSGVGLYRRYACPWNEVPWSMLKTAPSVSEADLLRGGWLVTGDCYLERFHPRGTIVAQFARGRRFPRE